MAGVWVDPVCATCGEPLTDKDRVVAVLPGTMRKKRSYASGYGGPGQMRVMPSKGRKGGQQQEVHHETCWPGVRSAGSGK